MPDLTNSNPYVLANAVSKVDGYYLPRPSDVVDQQLRAFDRAKTECLEALQAQLASIEALTFEQFCKGTRISVTPSQHEAQPEATA